MTGNPRWFDSILPSITRHTSEIIAELTGQSFEESLLSFMSSRVYSLLEVEGTKTWHYSPWLLADLYIDESEGRAVVYPAG